MGKVLKCRDAGVDCDFEARGETTEEIMQKAAAHAKDCPAAPPEITPEIVEKIKSLIKDE